MQIIKIKPQGFCKGVIKAIKKLNEALPNIKNNIYMSGGIVHNEHIINAYKDKGIIQINDFNEILNLLKENDTFIITAHGLSNKKRKILEDKNIHILDTTCDEVRKIQEIIFEKEKENYEIIYYGSKKHPECMAILEDHQNIHLIENINDIYAFNIKSNKILFASQTTASYLDVKIIEDLLKKKYKNIIMLSDICTATKQRQLALINKSKDCDLILIIGDKNSNNTSKLKEIASKNTKAILIENIEEMKDIDFANINILGITAGASTPNILVTEIIKTIENNNYISNIKNDDYIKI